MEQFCQCMPMEWSKMRRHHRRVVELDLRSQKVAGCISPFIGNLSFLRSIYLQDNRFQGDIPQQISHLSRLQNLNFSGNTLQGEIPSTLSHRLDLEVIYLGNNDLVGKILAAFGFLSKLILISIPPTFGNGDAGDLSFVDSLTNCTKLEALGLDVNGFGGVLPNSITNLSTQLKGLELGTNQLVRNIPAGELPMTLGNYLRLEVLLLSSNSFHESIPSSLASLKGLVELDLSRNNLSGTIPIDLEKLSFLEKLNLSFNNLDGDFGLAKFLTINTSNTTRGRTNSLAIKGPIGYVALEYGMGGSVSAQGDIYSHGILLLEMLTGKRSTNEMFKDDLSLHSLCKMALPDKVIDIADSQLLILEEELNDQTNRSIGKGKMRECLISLCTFHDSWLSLNGNMLRTRKGNDLNVISIFLTMLSLVLVR
ncbi:hypothetical protein JRO89_XS14G0112400 [Xanthoceras sorbifolium]|uniref:Serine-threonine/tyrosine-protein kinase catalytic domain-containing protein n=1 Tax=Xanthoceras sorbifolium TaxID=99658 RepID=A0ABQ8H4Y9_9ROSI|nr:hypothetical protein JRO89_XS14G0112400 [Xanthoceras sorbifolium]